MGTDGQKRLVIFGGENDVEVEMAYLKHDSTNAEDRETEMTIQMLKRFKLIKKLQHHDVDKELILKAIAAINVETEHTLNRRLTAKHTTDMVSAGDPTDISSVPLYCEDPRLSIERPGVQYRVIKIDEAEEPPRYLATDEISELLDVILLFVDLSDPDMYKKLQPAERKHLRKIECTHSSRVLKVLDRIDRM